MDRIDSANMAPGNKFQDANPSIGQEATSLNAEWFNGVQEELIGIIVAAGGAPTPGVYNQVLTAIQKLMAQQANGQFLAHASGATCDLGAAVGGVKSNNAQVTGTTTITSFGASASTANPLYYVIFSGALEIEAGAALATPGNANLNVSAGDVILAIYLGGGNWQVVAFFPAAGGTFGSNANGNWLVRPDGRLDQDGVSGALPTGANTFTVAVVFPQAFTGANPPVVTITPDNNPDGSDVGMGFEALMVGAAGNWTGMTIKGATLDISINITNVVHFMWRGVG